MSCSNTKAPDYNCPDFEGENYKALDSLSRGLFLFGQASHDAGKKLATLTNAVDNWKAKAKELINAKPSPKEPSWYKDHVAEGMIASMSYEAAKRAKYRKKKGIKTLNTDSNFIKVRRLKK